MCVAWLFNPMLESGRLVRDPPSMCSLWPRRSGALKWWSSRRRGPSTVCAQASQFG